MPDLGKHFVHADGVSAVDLVRDLIELEELAEHEADADRRRRLLNLADRVADREEGAKVSEAARILGVSSPTVRAWIGAGVLAAVPDRTPLRVELSSIAAAKRAADEVRRIKDDAHLLAEVYRVLRDRAALDRPDVRAGIEDLRAGRTIELTPELLDDLLTPPKRRKPSRSR
jgi:excisionase family DNA binding protein